MDILSSCGDSILKVICLFSLKIRQFLLLITIKIVWGMVPNNVWLSLAICYGYSFFIYQIINNVVWDRTLDKELTLKNRDYL